MQPDPKRLMPFPSFRDEKGICATGPVSRILSTRRSEQDGHSSRRRIAAPLQRPTRRFAAPSRHGPGVSRDPSLFGLAPCGVCLAPDIAARAVRSYRTFSPLPPFVRAKAVCFLWHCPSTGLEAGLPGVTWHTALRSSDFPLPPCAASPKRPFAGRQRPSGPSATASLYRCSRPLPWCFL